MSKDNLMPSTDRDKLIQEIRSIMREWEGMFPFPDPDDAGDEARIICDVPAKLADLITQKKKEAHRAGQIELVVGAMAFTTGPVKEWAKKQFARLEGLQSPDREEDNT